MKSARSRAATTYALNRGPHTWTSDGSSQVDGSVPATGTDDGPLSGLGGKGTVRSLAVIPNTGRFWQELDIAGYLALLALGGAFAWWRRRRDIPEESYA